MAVANMKCPKCGTTEDVDFEVGKRPEKKCVKCGAEMERCFKNLSVGQVVTDHEMRASQMVMNESQN